MATYLDEILAEHRRRAGADPRRVGDLDALLEAAPEPRPFAEAVRVGSGPAGGARIGLIAEIKRRSPSKGSLAEDLDAGRLAEAYVSGGASCLSVLTDANFFGGSALDLRQARAASNLPVLRKDFTVAEIDLYDARAMGADAVLLIVAALDDRELAGFIGLAGTLRMDALVEVHDETELSRALRAGARMVGVNQRDLRTFGVDRDRAVRLAGSIPDGIVKVAESGITTAGELVRLAEGGFHGALVGEALVTAPDPRQALVGLRGFPSESPTGEEAR